MERKNYTLIILFLIIIVILQTFFIFFLFKKIDHQQQNIIKVLFNDFKNKKINTTSPIILDLNTTSQVITDLNFKPVLLVELGEEFTLKKGEVAQVKNSNIFLKLKDFVYAPCPEDFRCLWSGLAVLYELVVDGKVYNTTPFGVLWYNAPYDVFVKKTDYKTYANFVIQKPEVMCNSLKEILKDECWRSLARRFNDISYCDKIESELTKFACFKDLGK